METGAVVVIVATSAGFAFLIGAVIWFLTHWDYPRGKRYSFTFRRSDKLSPFYADTVRIDLVVDRDVDLGKEYVSHMLQNPAKSVAVKEVARWCALALVSSILAVKRTNSVEKKAWKGVGNRLVVHVMRDVGDDNTEKEGDYEIRAVYGTVTKRIPWFSDPIPMARIEAQTLPQLEERGEPVIHEFMHGVAAASLDTFDPAHLHTEIWAKHGKGTLQSRATSIYGVLKKWQESSNTVAYK